MSQDKTMRARVDGKQETQASTVWELYVGGHGVRCRRIAEQNFAMETRKAKGGWICITTGPHPEGLLRDLLATVSWPELIRVVAREAKPKP